jgi:predicted nucleic acid-binding protein
MALALLDTNVLVHAVYRGSPLHAAAAELVDRGLRESHRFCIAPQNLVEFAAVVTRSRLVEKPIVPEEASRMMLLLHRSRRLSKIYPKRGTVARAMREGAALKIVGPVWYDLFLAVTMRDAGVRMIVTENVTDFSRFPFIDARPMSSAA